MRSIVRPFCVICGFVLTSTSAGFVLAQPPAPKDAAKAPAKDAGKKASTKDAAKKDAAKSPTAKAKAPASDQAPPTTPPVAAAPPAAPAAADANRPAAAEYQRLMEEWKTVLKDLRKLKLQYQSAALADQAKIQQEWTALIDKGNQTVTSLEAAGVKA